MNAGFILRFIDRRLSKWVVMNSEKNDHRAVGRHCEGILKLFSKFQQIENFRKIISGNVY